MAEVLMKHSRVPRKQAEDQAAKPVVKRGAKRGDLANSQGLLAPLKATEPASVICRYLADQRSSDIAASLGVTRSALNQWLLRTCESEWVAAQIARAITRKEAADEELEDARDPLSLARAREKLRSAQWDLERVFSRVYGQKQEVSVTVNTDLGERLRRARERVIDVPQGSISVIPSSEVEKSGASD